MTTQEHRVPMSDSTVEDQRGIEAQRGLGEHRAVEEQRETTEPLSVSQEPRTEPQPEATIESTDARIEPPVTESSAAQAEDLFADDELADLRGRWASVQAAFVDDPKDCVQKADGLVSDLVDQLTTGFARARTRLEEQWARGEQASTEDLRVALMHYREFFQRLLAV